MNALRTLLLLYLPLTAFAVLPVAGGLVTESLYPVRVYLTLGCALGGGLAMFALRSRGQPAAVSLREGWAGASCLDRWGLGVTVLYGGWVLLSSALSPLPGYAWLGYSYSQFGSLMLVACLGVLWVYRGAVPLRGLKPMMAIVTAIMAAVTAVEAVGLKPFAALLTSGSMGYPAALIGHRPHLGGWFALVALMPVFFYQGRRRDGWFWLWLLSGLVGLGLTTTTAASLGVLAGLGLWLLSSLQRRRDWQAPVLTTLFCVLCLWGLPLVPKYTASPLGTQAPTLKNYSSTGSFKPRLYLWKAAWNAALHRPLVGWGDETFAYQVFEYLSPADGDALIRAEYGFGPEYSLTRKGFTYYVYNMKDANTKAKVGNALYVRPHDVLADELYSHGFVGLLLFLGVAAYVLRQVAQTGPLTPFAIAFLPYAVYLLAWFYVVTVTPLYFALLGCALAVCRVRRAELGPAKTKELVST